MIWLNVCVIWTLDPMVVFVTSAALMGSHYKTNIISSVGHPRSDLVVPLVLCMVVYNIWGIGVVLPVHRNSVNPAENG
jgi:hypothetical protein